MPSVRNRGQRTSSFLVETYYPGPDHRGFAELVERVRAAAADDRHDGPTVRYVRSYLVPEDEMCMHVFEATSPDAVRRVASRAGIEVDRVVETVDETPRKTGR